MGKATWPRRAGLLAAIVAAIGISLWAGRSLLNNNEVAPDDKASLAKQALPAEEESNAAAEQKNEQQVQAGEKSPRDAQAPKYHLGIQFAPIPAALNEQFDLKGEGLLVQRIGLGGPADKAGIQQGDILLAIGEKPISENGDAFEVLNASEGKDVSLKLLRGGNTTIVTATPATFRGRTLVPKYRLGAAFVPIPADINERLNLKGEGLKIERVEPGGPADKAGIQQDDILVAVGDRSIKQYSDAVEALNASEGKEISMKLLRGDQTTTVSVTPAPHRKDDEKILVP